MCEGVWAAGVRLSDWDHVSPRVVHVRAGGQGRWPVRPGNRELETRHFPLGKFRAWTRGGAEFSVDGRYRYRLWRRWVEPQTKVVVFIMLNPSKADDRTDDATVRRCLGFAKEWGYGGLEIVNLFPLVSTDPKALDTLYRTVGTDMYNLELTVDLASKHDVVLAWGAVAAQSWFPMRAAGLLQQLHRLNKPVQVFRGLTKGGQPKHPLRLRKTHPLQTYWVDSVGRLTTNVRLSIAVPVIPGAADGVVTDAMLDEAAGRAVAVAARGVAPHLKVVK